LLNINLEIVKLSDNRYILLLHSTILILSMKIFHLLALLCLTCFVLAEPSLRLLVDNLQPDDPSFSQVYILLSRSASRLTPLAATTKFLSRLQYVTTHNKVNLSETKDI
jgi:hypothetical protein